MNTREARVKNAMGRLYDYVDDFFFESGLDCLNNRSVRFITSMVAEAMITQRDQTWECFEPTDRAETPVESLAEQG